MKFVSALPLSALAGLALLSGCDTAGTARPVVTATPSSAKNAGTPVSGRLFMMTGQTPEVVIAKFGQPSLDRQEKSARHLQFGGAPCILDVYFYAAPNTASLTARYTEARFIDGREADAAQCIDARLRALGQR